MPNILNTEKCVVCGVDTGVQTSLPVDNRKFYVVGCGQLCESCYRDVKQNPFSENIKVEQSEIDKLIEMCEKSAEKETL